MADVPLFQMHSTGRAIWALSLCVFLSCAPLSAAQQAALEQPVPFSASNKFVLDDGTPIRLRLNRNLSSADAKTGDTIDFEVLEEVKIGDVLVVPKGNIALGTVTGAEHKKHMGRGGKLDIEVDYVKLADGEKAALRAVKQTNGGGHVGAMTGAIVATSLVVWPAAPFFLFMQGKDTAISKGTEITAYINGTMPLDPARFAASVPATSKIASPSPVASQTPANARLEVTSNPAGAEICVDGNFVGDTPSELTLANGLHTITISRHGYRTWERKLTVSSGNITVTAELER